MSSVNVNKSKNPKSYSEEFKAKAVHYLIGPNSKGLKHTARKFNIPSSTLYGWKLKYASTSKMKKNNNNHILDKLPQSHDKPDSSSKKLEVVMQTASMTELELGSYLRSNGLHMSDLEIYKADILLGLDTIKKTKGRPVLTPEFSKIKKENKDLGKKLNRTEKALAEQTARIILLKKSHVIWGEQEEDE